MTFFELGKGKISSLLVLLIIEEYKLIILDSLEQIRIKALASLLRAEITQLESTIQEADRIYMSHSGLAPYLILEKLANPETYDLGSVKPVLEVKLILLGRVLKRQNCVYWDPNSCLLDAYTRQTMV